MGAHPKIESYQKVYYKRILIKRSYDFDLFESARKNIDTHMHTKYAHTCKQVQTCVIMSIHVRLHIQNTQQSEEHRQDSMRFACMLLCLCFVHAGSHCAKRVYTKSVYTCMYMYTCSNTNLVAHSNIWTINTRLLLSKWIHIYIVHVSIHVCVQYIHTYICCRYTCTYNICQYRNAYMHTPIQTYIHYMYMYIHQ